MLSKLKLQSILDVVLYFLFSTTESIKPNFYVKGPDYKNNSLDDTKKIYIEKKLVEKYNGKIVYTDDQKYSSSSIINNKNLINFNLKQEDFVKKIRNKYGFESIINKIWSIR